MPSAFPEPWHEVEDQDYIVEKYRARNPTLFVREDRDVGVHVVPVSPSSPHASEEYEVASIRGSASEFDAEYPIETFEDRVAAFERAEDFAAAYEDVVEARGDTASERDGDALEDALAAVE